MIPVALMEKLDRYPMRAYPNPSLAGRRVSHRFSVLAQSSLGPRARRRRLYLQQVFGAMPHRSRSHRRSSHVVMVTPLDRAAPLPLEHLAAITCKEPAFDPSATRGPTRRPCPDTPCAVRRRSEIRRVVLSRDSACRDRAWRRRMYPWRPAPEPCSLIAAVGPVDYRGM